MPTKLVKPAEFTISKTEWLRGEGSSRSKLLRASDDKKCCLGFYALACGLTQDEIIEIGSPGKLFGDKNFIIPDTLEGILNSTPVCALMTINDGFASDEYKIAEITRIFKADLDVVVNWVE